MNQTKKIQFFCGVAAVLVPFCLQYGYMLNLFYHFGAPYFDAGMFANLVWHNDLLLTDSEFYGTFSYLGVHFSPVLVLLNQLSYVVPTGKVEFYALFMATIYTSLSLAMYYALTVCLRPASLQLSLLIAALAVAFSFNGLVVQGLWMPHFEYAIPACIFMFLLHHRLGHKGPALFFFVLTLLLREDGGFHIFAFLSLLVCLDYLRLRRVAPLKRDLALLGIAFAYSVLACFMTFKMRALGGIGGSVFQQIYSGSPPYAHLTLHLIGSRLANLFVHRVYLWLALLVTLFWAWRLRSLYLLVPFAAGFPWFVFNLTAVNENTGTLYAYYLFPLVLCMGWPVLGLLWREGPVLGNPARRNLVLMQVMLAVAGLINYDDDVHAVRFVPTSMIWDGCYRIIESEEGRENVRRFTEVLGRNKDLGVVAADPDIMSLTMGSVAQNFDRAVKWQDYDQPVDTVVYISLPPEQPIRDLITKNHLPNHYCVTGTRVCMFTNRPRAEMGIFAPMVTEYPAVRDKP